MVSRALESKNAALTESLDQQTATSEILSVISRSPTDIRPVLNSAAESAARLCDALDATIFLAEEDVLRVVAQEEVMTVLREYHAAMGQLILEHEGTLERFTGDGMMIFFNRHAVRRVLRCPGGRASCSVRDR